MFILLLNIVQQNNISIEYKTLNKYDLEKYSDYIIRPWIMLIHKKLLLINKKISNAK